MDLNLEQLKKDFFVVKALIYLGDEGIKWAKCQMISPPNEHGQVVVRRIRNGWLGVTTKVRHINEADRAEMLENIRV